MTNSNEEFSSDSSRNDSSQSPPPPRQERVLFGVSGLDEVLDGGLLACRSYLVRGTPGSGKTILGLQFLTAGDGDPALFVGFQEPEAELRANAATMGLDMSGVEVLDLSPSEEFFSHGESYDVFHASDVEQTPIIQSIVETVERVRPSLVFIDALTQLRFLSADLFQFRKLVLSLLRFLTDRGSTVVFSSESTSDMPDDDLQFMCDGIINLVSTDEGRVLKVTKFRGSQFIEGGHQYRLDRSGFHVFPRPLPPAKRGAEVQPVQLGTGNTDLDKMLHGGLEAGTSTLITGPTGVGKSTLSSMCAIEAARTGHRAVCYHFEEEIGSVLTRLTKLGIQYDSLMEAGSLAFEQIEPLRYLSDEFTTEVLKRISREGLELVVLDSVAGFGLSMAHGEEVNKPLHAFVKALSRAGVSIVLVNETRASTEGLVASEREMSYMADNVVYLRYVQNGNSLDRNLGILKKRLSGFEPDQRPFEIGTAGIALYDFVDGRPADAP